MARPSATVILVRDSPAGPELFVHRRPASMAFAAGATVFPGGRVEPHDADCLTVWSGTPATEFAARMQLTEAAGSPESAAAGFVGAAVRETFEEASVLLAEGATAPGPPQAEWLPQRADVEAGRTSLTELLIAHDMTLRADSLGLWAHWITPEFEPRRYDTWFFVATLPAGQDARADTTEAEAAAWVRPADAVEAVRAGRTAMLPPTFESCRELAELIDAGALADDLLEATRDRAVPVHQPVVIERDGRLFLEVS